MKKRLFVSHIAEERDTAKRLNAALARNFLRLLDVFVSSDTESIAAGEEWRGSAASFGGFLKIGLAWDAIYRR